MPKKRSAAKVTYTTLFADETLHPKFEAALKAFRPKLGESHPMIIGGAEVWSGSGEFEHRSPVDTSIVVGKFQVGTREHARSSIDAARDGFERWSNTPWEKRVRTLERFSKLIDQRKFEIAVAITYEVGKNRLEALAECWEAMDAVKLYSKIMKANRGYHSKLGEGGPGEHNHVVGKPYGVWPVISPFNFPFMLLSSTSQYEMTLITFDPVSSALRAA